MDACVAHRIRVDERLGVAVVAQFSGEPVVDEPVAVVVLPITLFRGGPDSIAANPLPTSSATKVTLLARTYCEFRTTDLNDRGGIDAVFDDTIAIIIEPIADLFAGKNLPIAADEFAVIITNRCAGAADAFTESVFGTGVTGAGAERGVKKIDLPTSKETQYER
jgi:hypothetical protein